MINNGFNEKCVVVNVSDLVYGKDLPANIKASIKYNQIKSSIVAVGIIEPVVIYLDINSNKIILDGHLRVEALKDLEIQYLYCLIAKDEESYSYNRYLNRITVIQEHRMIIKAVEDGVSEDKLSEALNISISALKDKFKLLNGICHEVVVILADKQIPKVIFSILRKMKTHRQIEVVSTMISLNNFSRKFALSLLHTTTEDMLNNPKDSKLTDQDTARNFARLEREMISMEMKSKQLECTYATNNLKLAVIISHVRSLLANYAILNWLVDNKPEYLKQLKRIASIDEFPDNIFYEKNE
ncbi:TPA: plasmid partitioning protein RepB C-terminal domain-containing protein [Yersinia enterocolitica]|uniref:plasmid partitioning protein RepB C-terminal domain-containing protein n=1 Tax=Yersinia enterocolitica TaxID=630 RepID=UPI0028B69216|nr:RepB plasmid partitioning protein [Yersinia enterocolitica]ELI7990140.1 RepB plasmid partitioning protein [Yersinia enterocolitica]